MECRARTQGLEERIMTRMARGVLRACIALFLLLEVPAMALYPGGTWWEPGLRGHRFWQNFLCDLEWRVALNGQPNPVGSMLAQGAMLVLVAGFVPFWSLASRRGRAARGLGLASVAGMIAVALMPSERFGALHGAAVMAAGLTGLGAAGLATLGQLRTGRKGLAALGTATLVVSLVDLALYARAALYGGPGSLLVPALQKVALLFLLAWMSAVTAAPRDATETPVQP